MKTKTNFKSSLNTSDLYTENEVKLNLKKKILDQETNKEFRRFIE